jgi:hypothetical protein
MSVEKRNRVLELALFVDLATLDNCRVLIFSSGSVVDHEP